MFWNILMMIIQSLRIRYFLSHLIVSVVIASVSLYVVFCIWYPKPLDIAVGVGNVTLIMLAIDVIIGPLLTLMLVKKNKKYLKLDLITIAILQILALLYGLYSINKGRPVVIAFDVNRFELVQKHMVKDNHQTIIKQYAKEQGKNIPVVSIRPAKDEKELVERMHQELEQNITVSANATLYEPLTKNMDIISKEMKPISELSKFNNKDNVTSVLTQYPQADGFLPIISSGKNLTVLIDSKNKVFVSVVDLRPW